MSHDLSGLRVLIIEDEAFVSWLLSDILTSHGCIVVGSAAKLDQALAMISDADFDFAVVDVNLNGVCSYPAADMLEARRIPFVFSTGYGRQGLEPAYQRFAVIQKPFGEQDLLAVLKDLLRPGDAPRNGSVAGGR
jgi:CheY-like chemotaxis protein